MKAHAPGQSPLLLLDVVRVLAVGGIDYAVIGAMAAAVHGTIRGTTDADAVLSISLQRLKKLEIALAQTGLLTELRRGDQDDPIPAMLVVRDAHDNRVDLLAGLRGLDPNSFSRTIAVPFHGDSIRVIGCEDFIAMKCFAGGPQDLVDAREALRTNEAIRTRRHRCLGGIAGLLIAELRGPLEINWRCHHGALGGLPCD